MKNAILSSLLALWLVASFGLWLLGLGFSGDWVPPINFGTVIGIYAPWLIFAVLVARKLLNQK